MGTAQAALWEGRRKGGREVEREGEREHSMGSSGLPGGVQRLLPRIPSFQTNQLWKSGLAYWSGQDNTIKCSLLPARMLIHRI